MLLLPDMGPHAARRVFDIHELVENILIHLPLYDLLLATKICFSFLQVVLSSRDIRKRLQWEVIPVFANFFPGKPKSEDLCNINTETPWFFRMKVSCGFVIVLKVAHEDVQLCIQDAPAGPIRILDSKRTVV